MVWASPYVVFQGKVAKQTGFWMLILCYLWALLRVSGGGRGSPATAS